jgi:hypothetical protein
LESSLRERASELAERVLTWVLTTHAQLLKQHHAALQTVKNIPCARRRAIYLPGFCDDEAQTAAVRRLLYATVSGSAQQLRPIVDGLTHVVAGGRFSPAGLADGGTGRRLLGWSVGEHWLLAPVAGPARRKSIWDDSRQPLSAFRQTSGGPRTVECAKSFVPR